MAVSMNLSLTFVLLLSGLVVFGEVGGAKAVDCSLVRCFQPGYITCKNYPGKLDGCACVCAPEDGENCVLHLKNGTRNKCRKTE
ncbi:hypothetical protein EJB05_04682, partial [Eragrostis curvula]